MKQTFGKGYRTLDQMTDDEAILAIQEMTARAIEDLKKTGQTLQDLYSPVEDWIPTLIRICRNRAEAYIVRTREIEKGDVLVVKAPAGTPLQNACAVAERVFRSRGVQVLGCPSDCEIVFVRPPPDAGLASIKAGTEIHEGA